MRHYLSGVSQTTHCWRVKGVLLTILTARKQTACSLLLNLTVSAFASASLWRERERATPLNGVTTGKKSWAFWAGDKRYWHGRLPPPRNDIALTVSAAAAA